MTDIQVRAMEPGDTEALHELYRRPLAFSNTLQLPFRSLEFRRQWLAQGDANSHSLVALVDGRVEGTARGYAMRDGAYVDTYFMARRV